MNIVDKIIAFVDPAAGMKRAAHRAALETVRSYEAASRGRRTESWKATSADANKEIEMAAITLRNRAREQARNNPYAKRIVQAVANNVIGKGIRPSPEGVTKAQDKRIMKEWKWWGEKSRCDFDGNTNFYGIQKLVTKTLVTSGECIILKRREINNRVPLSVQVLEPDYIDSSKNMLPLENGNMVFQGIEFNQKGKRVAYWLFKEHPGSDRQMDFQSRRVDIEFISHVYVVERPGQIRGVTWLAASIIRMRDFDEYEDAELVRQKIAACFTVFISDTDPESDVKTEDDREIASRVEPGIIEILPPGKSISFAQPPLTNGYESYSRQILRGIAAGSGITYEQMTGDLSNVNFSSGRMGWIEAQRNFEETQDHVIAPMLLDKVWGWFIEALNISGIFIGECDASWTPPRREMIDPVKETKAMAMQVRNGFISYQEALRQLGYDPEDTLDEIAAFNKLLDSLGIVLDTDPRVDLIPKDTVPEEKEE